MNTEEIKEISEAEKPKLRHGDYGRFVTGTPRLFCRNSEGVLQPSDQKKMWGDDANSGNCMNGYTILGNIFADLKALAKPLKGFIEGGVRYSINTGHGIHAGMIQIGIDFWTIQNVKSHILDLRRLVHTAEQEAAK